MFLHEGEARGIYNVHGIEYQRGEEEIREKERKKEMLTCNNKNPGGGSEEIMSELAIREEVKDLKKYASGKSRL